MLRWHGLPAKKQPQTGLLCAAFRAVGECEMSHPPAPPRVTPSAAWGWVHTTPCLVAGGSPRKEGAPPTSPGSLWPLSLVVGSNWAPKTKRNFAHEQVEANGFAWASMKRPSMDRRLESHHVPSSFPGHVGVARTAAGTKNGRFHQLTSMRQGAGCSPEPLGSGTGRGGGGGGRPQGHGCVLELGRVSLAAASSGRSPYLSEDFVTMATLMSSALQQRAALTSSATFFFFLPHPPPGLGFLFIYFFISHRR